jgi:hypothetical protein
VTGCTYDELLSLPASVYAELLATLNEGET